MMRNEKAGGHGERPGAVGLLDAALWDLAAKQAGVPLWELIWHPLTAARPTTRSPSTPAAADYRDENDIALLGEDIRRAHRTRTYAFQDQDRWSRGG